MIGGNKDFIDKNEKMASENFMPTKVYLRNPKRRRLTLLPTNMYFSCKISCRLQSDSVGRMEKERNIF